MKDWWDHFTSGHIAVSPKGWTTNELGAEWFKRCFDPKSKKHQKGEYRLLILDRHASHISTEVIKFCTENKIILLCEEPHTTHLCQPLDCGVFLQLSTQIKLGIQARCCSILCIRLISVTSWKYINRLERMLLRQRIYGVHGRRLAYTHLTLRS
jgi:hypothetical protein